MTFISTPLPETTPEDLQGLRVLIFGLGTFGGGVGAARFFSERRAEVVVTDHRRRDALARSVDQLRDCSISRWRLGRHRAEDFEEAEWVVVNPAVPPDNPFLVRARRSGARVVTEIGLFLRWCPTRHLAGVTGSNGKSTTAQLAHDLLRSSDLRVHLGGNFGGSLLPRLDQIRTGDRVVLELSSFQLARLGLQFPRPPVAAITQYSPNHLDWHGSESNYRDAKERILESSAPRACGAAILPSQSAYFDRWADRARRLSRPIIPFAVDHVPPGGVGFQGDVLTLDISNYAGSPEAIVTTEELPLRGPAQRGNVACAVAIAAELGGRADAMKDEIRRFRPLRHRQERLDDQRGVRFINDSKATTSVATASALEAFGPRVVLLAGGSSKGESFLHLVEAVKENSRHVILYGTTASRIEQTLLRGGLARDRLTRADDLDLAFQHAMETAEPGDTVLLSPACASYDQFRNYEERGDRFRELVNGLSIEN